MVRRILCIAVVLTGFSLASGDAQGQQPTRYQPPSRPTISPYMDYFRQPTGILPRYYQYIRPEQQLRQNLYQQQQQISQLGSQLNQVGGQVQQMRQGSVMPTGTAATFFNYSHYYSFGGRR